MKIVSLVFLCLVPYIALLAKDAPPASVTIVRIPVPWYAPNFYVTSRMKKSLPEYQSAPGLLYKYFTFGEDGTFGGIYLWKDRAAADAWFTPQWIAERSKKYGHEITVPRYDVLAVTSVGESAPLLEGKYTATLVKYDSVSAETRAAVLARFREETKAERIPQGLLRAYLVETAPASYAVISLWNRSAQLNKNGEKFRVPLAIANTGK